MCACVLLIVTQEKSRQHRSIACGNGMTLDKDRGGKKRSRKISAHQWMDLKNKQTTVYMVSLSMFLEHKKHQEQYEVYRKEP